MKHLLSMLCFVLITTFGLTACDGLAAAAPGASPASPATPAPATAAPTAEVLPSPTAVPPAAPTTAPVSGAAVSFDRLSLVVPTGVAIGGSGTLAAEATGDNSAPWWAVAPAHVELKLEGYALQGKVNQPQIYVYPAEAYAQVSSVAAENLKRLRAVLAGSAPLTNDTLPDVPFFNAKQIFASNVKVIPFKNGQGVRIVTQYAQGLMPVNNNELFYHFEGLTSDGKYYVVAILPVNAPGLPADAQLGATVPAGGVPMPDLDSANPDMPGYYGKVQKMLDGLEPGAYTPSLDLTDTLIGSMSVSSNN
jgi:hypothetical protein